MFFFSDGFIGIVGEMDPEDFPLVTKEYFSKLVIDNKTVHIFQSIGEEYPVRSDPTIWIRAFRTSDNIKELLDFGLGKDMYIIGSLDEKVLDPNFNFL